MNMNRLKWKGKGIRWLSTFVSEYFKLDKDVILQYLDRKKLEYVVSAENSEIVIKKCPFCHPIKGWILFLCFGILYDCSGFDLILFIGIWYGIFVFCFFAFCFFCLFGCF